MFSSKKNTYYFMKVSTIGFVFMWGIHDFFAIISLVLASEMLNSEYKTLQKILSKVMLSNLNGKVK